ncbi:MAG: beta-lactamase family protein [Chlamydiia bacterium]|nr:beta-lactamase family protein [Chlamydiia bacterium]
MFRVFLTLCMGLPFFSSSIEQKLDQIVRSHAFQGSVLIAKRGNILFHRGYGFANLEHNIPNTPETIFRIGSLTKQFTAVAILQLQEQGLLNVKDPIEQYLPGYPQGNTITIHHLLTHTSGIAEITDFENLKQIQRDPSTPILVMHYFQHLPLRFLPGSQCIYTNSNYILLGAIIENVTGQTYEEVLKKQIFTPLDLLSTHYDHNRSIIPNRASGYFKNESNEFLNAEFVEMSFPHASGALAASTKDLNTFYQALFSNKILSSKSLEALIKPHATSEDGEITYGYGFRIGPHNRGLEEADLDVIGHFGSIEGFSAGFVHYPSREIIIILLSNLERTNVRALQKELFSSLKGWRPRR